MNENIVISADAVAKFCRLQMNVKRDMPIRPSEMGVLIYTQKNEIPVTPLMLSKFFGISKPSVTSMINSLIKKDYMVKKQSSSDGRSYTVFVTSKGSELVESTYNEYFKAMEILEEKMGTQKFELFIQLIQNANRILSEGK